MGYLAELDRVFSDSHSWSKIVILVPHDPRLLTGFGSLIGVLILVAFIIKAWKATHGTAWNIKPVELPDADWNLVQAGVGGTRERLTQSAKIGDTYTVTLSKGWKSQTVRLEVRKIAAHELRMSTKLIGRLGIEDDAEHPPKIGISIPYFRPDLWTFWHPDPSIRLQWRVGAMFMILGVILPKILDRYLGL